MTTFGETKLIPIHFLPTKNGPVIPKMVPRPLLAEKYNVYNSKYFVK